MKNRLIFIFVTLLMTGYLHQAVAVAVWVPGWQQTSQMHTPRAGAAVLEVDGVIYAIGGVDGRKFLKTNEYSRIQPDGLLGPWQKGALLNDERGFFDAVAHNGFIYAVGGGKGDNGKILLRSVERGKIGKDGEIEGWVTEKHRLTYPRRCAKLFVANGRIYALGGFGGALLDSVESAAINEDGSLGDWRVERNPLTMTRYINSVKFNNGVAYVIGGHAEREGTGLTEVEYAIPDNNGELVWKPTVAMKVPRYALSSAAHGDRIYALGGLNGAIYTDVVEVATQQQGGGLSGWRYTTPLSSQRANFGSVVYNDRLFIIGGTNRDGYYKTVEYANFNEKGDIGFWGSQQQLDDYQRQQQAQKQKPKRKLPNSGEVAEVIQTTAYSYLRVTRGVTEQWLAGPRGEYSVGQQVEYSRGLTMSDFFSSTLNRKFPSIIFVEHLRPAE